MVIKCESFKNNMDFCNCSYSGCNKKGNCCACLKYHLNLNQLPACCFPDDVEKTYDRSFKKFIEVNS